MEDSPYKTSDTALASYLVTQGMKIVGTVQADDNPKVRIFVFLDVPERDKYVEEYITGRARVQPKKYAYTYKIVKEFLYEPPITGSESDVQGRTDGPEENSRPE